MFRSSVELLSQATFPCVKFVAAKTQTRVRLSVLFVKETQTVRNDIIL